ncbi:citrate (Si)-synthase [Neolewinella lacunae]|uniref:citrate synthase (unknown stereospecificity) n=1 Tax=Neolewinella lacunae TaxID=1517758 RepID=A0A923TEZ2_9BACT|nr:citrate (Si)-synthase [Neolewinella lacunae]MBC6996447.1 citrate (Si)-synthase [Neolewinella lacunae]MDN3633610.1 citrate (Si)-synthase [Neolewinella lacunae]
MESLKQKFAEKAIALYQELREINKAHGDLKVDEVTLGQITGGARSIKMMLWETSQLDAIKGIRFRGYSIPELKELLPSGPQGEPKPEGLFWLMLTGEIPTAAEVDGLTADWHARAGVPDQVFKTLDSLPEDTHPMTQFTIGIMAMQPTSIFERRYAEGMPKSEYWDAVYEDSMNLIARLPRVAAYIYRRAFKGGKHIAPDTTLDYSANYAHMLGSDDEDFRSLMRLYLTIHADHEGGNASAHTVNLVGSTLSDPYLSFAAGMNALAGPLHGLANQEVIKWIFEMIEALGTDRPTKEQIADYVNNTLAEGKVIPGYGHAVLREPDPRFTAQRKFAEQYIKDSNLITTVWNIFDVVPPILEGLGKVKNPWPNVDAHSGALLVHYGFREYSYYTVLFGVSRALGVLAAGIWSRALGMPLERPKSVTSDWLKAQVNK